jgi:F0F1-type ATP synthase membrane subunit b/b'
MGAKPPNTMNKSQLQAAKHALNLVRADIRNKGEEIEAQSERIVRAILNEVEKYLESQLETKKAEFREGISRNEFLRKKLGLGD